MHASAPGKLMLSGEYAVLRGAPALVAAVDRRVRVSLVLSDAPAEGVLEVRTDLPSESPAHIDHATWDPPALPSSGARFVAHILDALLADRARRRLRSVTVQSAALCDGPGGAKLGLGSSAAVAAALAAAVEAMDGGSGDAAAICDRARRGHTAAAGRLGSGVDVAAASFGGLAAYRLADGRIVREDVTLPPGASLGVFWTGEPADTATFLAGLRTFAVQHPALHRACMERLGGAAEAVLEACRIGRTPDFLDAVGRYGHAMAALGETAGLDIVTDAHARLARLARDLGCVAKPSGAGGGDVAVAFAPSASHLRALEEHAARAGFPPIEAVVTNAGAHATATLEGVRT